MDALYTLAETVTQQGGILDGVTGLLIALTGLLGALGAFITAIRALLRGARRAHGRAADEAAERALHPLDEAGKDAIIAQAREFEREREERRARDERDDRGRM